MKPSEMTDEQLVKAVAEEVMEWKPLPFHQLKKEYEDLVFVDANGNMWLLLDTLLSPPGTFPENFLPLTDPRHWMMVVERMRELGRFVTIIAKDYGFIVLFEMIPYWAGQYGITDWFSNPNIGRAICEAALAAVRAAR